ncbi:hypothetical protein FEM48_Zijuj10G0127100 [Ziziphus jujuba var. spinosa]|uniref:nicotinate-nucleotide diphosphorylase (carboxylating) n=1 Tax=Ziziphus jujuba var. spinosa TaxID=714518 RepID=A0A978UNG2_ZIZJJ|nr:hypothetical protein FEM48_Zijuj10G0127100 [Ziziphus jujuba var. spinosa]
MISNLSTILQPKCQSPRLPRIPLLRDTRARVGSSIVRMSAATVNSKVSMKSIAVKPPSHPTYDLRGVIKLALAEDAADLGDVTSMATIPSDVEVEAHFLAKEDGIIAGIALGEMVFNEVDPSLKVEWFQNDGDFVRKGLKIGRVYGKVGNRRKAHSIVVAERVALNFMQRMSGIATLTKINHCGKVLYLTFEGDGLGLTMWEEKFSSGAHFKMASTMHNVDEEAMADAAHPALILETRKTAPGLRLVDKWAVLIGGGRNHRMGLFDMVLIKDNHISSAGGIINAIKAVDLYLEQRNLKMEVEVVYFSTFKLFGNSFASQVETRTLEEVNEVLHFASQTKTSLTRIMLDNMVVPLPDGDVDVSMLQEAVQLINGRFETEASGNITLQTIHKIGGTGVTFISSGALTHSVKALDISLKIDTELALQVGRRTNRA